MSKDPDINDYHLKYGSDAVRQVLDRSGIAVAAGPGKSEASLHEEKQSRGRRRKRARTGDGPRWPDVTEHGAPKKTCANARVAIEALDVSCRYDVFHDTIVIESVAIEHLSGAHMDHVAHLLRLEMHDQFEFDPGKEHVYDAIIQIGLRNRFDPIRDYLDGLR
jgi:hypothetical protein